MRQLIQRFFGRRSSAYPWTYVESWLAGHRTRSMFESVQCYAMFIGQPRSGTSLVGSLLNAHRHILIAQELNTLRYLARGYRRDQLFWLLWARDRQFHRQGRTWTGYDYQVPGQWQGCCQALHVIGDKKAGASTELLGKHPELLDRLAERVRVPLRILHVVRNPFDVIATIHRKRTNTTLSRALSMYFERCDINRQLLELSSHDILTVHLEELIAQPLVTLTRICSFVGQSAELSYLDACSKKLFTIPRQSQTTIAWSSGMVADIERRMRDYPFLANYRFQPQRAAA